MDVRLGFFLYQSTLARQKMSEKIESLSLAEALGASLGNVPAIFGIDQIRGPKPDPAEYRCTLVVVPDAIEIHFCDLPEGLLTLKQLGQVMLPLCIADKGAQGVITVIRHGDMALNTQLPVEAVLCLDEAANSTRIQDTLRVTSITTVPARTLERGGATVRCALRVARGNKDARDRFREVIIDYLDMFAIVHGASGRVPLHVDYDVFGERGTLTTTTRPPRLVTNEPRMNHVPWPGGATFTGTSGFSIKSRGRSFMACAALWAEPRGTEGPRASTQVDGWPGTELVCFDASGLLSDSLAKSALSKSGWKRRGGLTYRTGKDGSPLIQSDDLRIVRVVLYVHPSDFGGPSRVFNANDGPEGLARSAINTAVSSLRAAVGESALARGRRGPADDPSVDDYVRRMAECLIRVRARASSRDSPDIDRGARYDGARNDGARNDACDRLASSLRRILAPT